MKRFFIRLWCIWLVFVLACVLTWEIIRSKKR